MASYPVTVYRWDDPGAPQLDNGKISSFFNILHKCLVEGYGDKAPLGWTRSFYDSTNFKAAWRNNAAAGGSAGSAYFYSNTNTDVNNTLIRLTSCKSITDLGVVTGQGRLTAARFDAAITRWVLIGTSIGFYFYSFGSSIAASGNGLVNSSTDRPAFYAGDIFSVIPTDAGKFVMFHDINTSGDNSSPSSTRSLTTINNNAYSTNGGLMLWDADNFASATGYSYASIAQISPGQGDSIENTVHPLVLNNVSVVSIQNFNGPNHSSNVDRLGVSIKNSLIRPAHRGIIPGLLVSYRSFGFNQALPLIKTQAGISYHALPIPAVTGSSAAVIQASGDWHDPFV